MSDINLSLAKRTYGTLLEAVEANNWKCARDDNAKKITYGLNGTNLHMDFTVFIDVEKQVVCLRCAIPFKFSSARIGEGAQAIGAANYTLSAGCFNLKITDGTVSYRLAMSYRDSILSKEALLFLLNYSAWAIDKYYKFFNDLNNGARTLQSLLAEIL